MTGSAELHANQAAFWNGAGGANWVRQQAQTDAMLAPVAEAVIAKAAPQPHERVLDIGCGCGTTTLMLAPLVRHVTGLDISEPMLDVARQRGAGISNIEWLAADALTYSAPEPFDLLFSRFGVMFFGDPTAAFTNLRRALTPGGRLVFVCWRAFADNPWMQVPLHAAYDAGVPRMPRPGPEEPGPFSFADTARVSRILTAAGFAAPDFSKFDVDLDVAGNGGMEAAMQQATQIGAAASALREAPEDLRPAAIAAMRRALEPYLQGDRVLLPAAMWLVTSG